MRRGLQWALGLVMLVSVVSFCADEAPRLVAPLERRVAWSVTNGDRPPPVPALAIETAPEPLPARIEPLSVEPAKRDIFAPVIPPAPKVVPLPPPVAPPPVVVPVVVQQPAPPPPPAPAMPYRYLGSMLTPDGQRLVLLARGETAVPIAVGTRLDEGYVVEAVTDEVVRLVYPALGSVVLVQVPPSRTP